MTDFSEIRIPARAGASDDDRQRVLDELCRRELRGFVGRPITPMLVYEAEGVLREAIVDAIRSGNYVLPDELELDRVTLGSDMRLKVMFKTSGGVVLSEGALRILSAPPRTDNPYLLAETDNGEHATRFEAVAAEVFGRDTEDA